MPPEYSGRLELTWTNKDLCLLARESGEYEWVPRSDYRVAEVRLLRDAAMVGEVNPVAQRARDNLLIRGDALGALTALTELPEFAHRLVGSARVAYLDPPFNTQQSFLQYDDALEHSVWLTMMRDLLLQIRRLLAPNGSVWVHCDDAEQAHLRVLMNEVFGADNFIATAIWERADTLRNDALRASVSHDYIIAFAAELPRWRSNRLARTAEMDAVYGNPDDDPRGPWLPASLISPAYRKSGDFVITGPSGREHRPPAGTSWRVPEQTFDELLAEKRISFGRDGNGVPQRKRFLSEVGGRVLDTLWKVKDVGGNRQSKAEIKKLFPGVPAFETPKPERLMRRVIEVASDPGDLVLDCFLGSGTTAAVAHKMGRRWIGVERAAETLDSFAIPRLTKVVVGEDPGGITEEIDWTGGGGFRVLDVGPSMFEDDEGVVVLADWATNSELAEATAAQLGFAHDPAPPFCGREGRSRLAVIDGLVNKLVVNLLVGALGEDELLTVCGTSVDDQAAEALRAMRPGSRVRKIPASLLIAYQVATRWSPRTVARTDSEPKSTANSAPSTAPESVRGTGPAPEPLFSSEPGLEPEPAAQPHPRSSP